jgi:hypothetical protein
LCILIWIWIWTFAFTNATGKIRTILSFALASAYSQAGEANEKLIEVLGRGTLVWSKNNTYLDLLIQDTKTLYFIASIINGKMRTPKIEAHHRLIQWFNNKKII